MYEWEGTDVEAPDRASAGHRKQIRGHHVYKDIWKPVMGFDAFWTSKSIAFDGTTWDKDPLGSGNPSFRVEYCKCVCPSTWFKRTVNILHSFMKYFRIFKFRTLMPCTKISYVRKLPDLRYITAYCKAFICLKYNYLVFCFYSEWSSSFYRALNMELSVSKMSRLSLSTPTYCTPQLIEPLLRHFLK